MSTTATAPSIIVIQAAYGAVQGAKDVTGLVQDPGRLLVGRGDLANLYLNGALDPLKDPLNKLPLDVPKDPIPEIRQAYEAALGAKAEIPQRDPMTEALSQTIQKESGPLRG